MRFVDRFLLAAGCCDAQTGNFSRLNKTVERVFLSATFLER